MRIKLQIAPLWWPDGMYVCSDFFFSFSQEKKMLGQRFAISIEQAENYNGVVLFNFFHFLTLLGTDKFHTHFWNELLSVIGTTGWESKSKRKEERCRIEKVLYNQFSLLLTLLTRVQGIHGKFGLRKSQISKRKVSGLAFIKPTFNWPSVEDSTFYSFHEISVYKSTHPKSQNCNADPTVPRGRVISLWAKVYPEQPHSQFLLIIKVHHLSPNKNNK